VKKMLRSQKGFTLIELLIVIVILGVLAAAIIPNLSKFLGSGQVGAANAELASVRTGIAAYQADNDGALPVLADGTTVDNAAILVYITGSSAIRADYTIDSDTTSAAYSSITDADPETVSSGGGTPWGTVVAWGADKWEKP
jgi:type IV pilus assembly protein PilA